MADERKLAHDVSNQINAIKSVNDFYSVNWYLNNNKLKDINPIKFIIDILLRTKGSEFVYGCTTEYLTKYIEKLELVLKWTMFGFLEGLMSCSVKPIITEKMIKEGVCLNLPSVDFTDLLRHEPVIVNIPGYNDNKPGKYLYFGCHNEDGIYTYPDLVKCKDFNAVLWYAKNTPNNRVVWKKDDNNNDINVSVNLPIGKIYKIDYTYTFNNQSMTIKKYLKKEKDSNGNEIYKTLTGDDVTVGQNGYGNVVEEVAKRPKQKKSDGILTMEFNPNPNDITNSEHQKMYNTEPIQDCLHVFFGYCNEIESNKAPIKKDIDNTSRLIEKVRLLKLDINNSLKDLEDISKEIDATQINDYKENRQKLRNLSSQFNLFSNKKIREIITDSGFEISTNSDTNTNIFLIPFIDKSIKVSSDIIDEKPLELERQLKELYKDYNRQSDGVYPPSSANYYCNHFLAEFNYDIIFSMKWFDSKVLVAQMIDSITHCFDVVNVPSSLDISIQGRVVKEKINSIIERVIENDDDIINDCFFSFNNDDVNRQLQITEMRRMGVNTLDGENVTPSVSPADVFSAINSLSSNATKEEITSAIEHSIFMATSSGQTEYAVEYTTNLNMFYLIELLIKKLICSIVGVILSPKIYLIIMLNLKILERNISFSLLQFIDYFNSMFIEIVKTVRDNIIDFFQKILRSILNDLLSIFKPILLQELYDYYKTLIQQAISCVELHRSNNIDWDADSVQYADILDPVTSVNENNC